MKQRVINIVLGLLLLVGQPYQSWAQESLQADFTFLVDRHYSATLGAETLISFWRGYQVLDDMYFMPTEGDTSALAGMKRLGKLILLENTLARYMMVAQHEVWGHGAHARRHEVDIQSYDVKPWGGRTRLNLNQYQALRILDKANQATAGFEATTHMSARLRQQWLRKQAIDRRDALFYLVSNLDAKAYFVGLRHDRAFAGGNDIGEYINLVNTWQGQAALSKNKLKPKMLLSFIDPFFYYSLLNLGHYVVSGQQQAPYYMAPAFDKLQWLGAISTYFTPCGPEIQPELWFLSDNGTLYQAKLRYSKSGAVTSWGLQLGMDPLLTIDNIEISSHLSLWQQPKDLDLERLRYPVKYRCGGAWFVQVGFPMSDFWHVFAEVGIKTRGYMPTEALTQTAIGRIGVKFSL